MMLMQVMVEGNSDNNPTITNDGAVKYSQASNLPLNSTIRKSE